jgi:transcriptional regulator
MLGILGTLNYEDRETFYQTLAAAIPQLTEMQMRCLLLSLLGLTQEQTARILGVTQRSVSHNARAALATIAEAAMEYR